MKHKRFFGLLCAAAIALGSALSLPAPAAAESIPIELPLMPVLAEMEEAGVMLRNYSG